MVRVKVCGLTNREDALAAVSAGADALGFVFAESPRQVQPDIVRSIATGLPPFVSRVGVFVNADPEYIIDVMAYCKLNLIQFSGHEGREIISLFSNRAIRVVHVADGPLPELDDFGAGAILLDTASNALKGGTGKTFDWTKAVEPARTGPIILAGGLNTANVATAVKQVNPHAVDVSSGLEKYPGKKDHDQIRQFVSIAKSTH